jgi:hypothetical protein
MRAILESVAGLGAFAMFMGAFMTFMGALGQFAWSRMGGVGRPSLRDVIDIGIGDPTEASFVLMALLRVPGLWAMAVGGAVTVFLGIPLAVEL